METESQLAIKRPPAKLGAHCRHSDFANSSPGSKRSGTSMMSSWSPCSWLEASIVPTQIDPFPTEIFPLQSAHSWYCPPWSPHPQLITFQLLPCSTIIIPLHPVPSQPLVLGQWILLACSTSRTYFGQIKSIVRLEKSYLVISVSPKSSAYGPFIPLPCQVYLPTSFLVLPPLRCL